MEAAAQQKAPSIVDTFGSVKSRRKQISNLSPDNATIKALYEAGKSTRQIEGIIGHLDHTTIARRLKKLTPRKNTEIYKELRADIFAEKQRQLMMLSNVAEYKNARDQRDLATTTAIYYDKERLERGLSSSNVSVQVGLSSTLQASIDSLVKRVPDECAIVAQQDTETVSTAK